MKNLFLTALTTFFAINAHAQCILENNTPPANCMVVESKYGNNASSAGMTPESTSCQLFANPAYPNCYRIVKCKISGADNCYQESQQGNMGSTSPVSNVLCTDTSRVLKVDSNGNEDICVKKRPLPNKGAIKNTKNTNINL